MALSTDKEKNHTEEEPAKMTIELKEKIKSKIDVAKFFAGFITVFIGLILKEGILTSMLSKLGILFIVISLIFCVMAVFAYDHMLWPKNYWYRYRGGHQSEVDYQKKLVKEMLHSWWSLFLPGVICFGIGLFLILFQSLNLGVLFSNISPGNWVVLVIFLLAAIIPLWLWGRMWPDFGKPTWEKEKEATEK